jgi:hypothetical protein
MEKNANNFCSKWYRSCHPRGSRKSKEKVVRSPTMHVTFQRECDSVQSETMPCWTRRYPSTVSPSLQTWGVLARRNLSSTTTLKVSPRLDRLASSSPLKSSASILILLAQCLSARRSSPRHTTSALQPSIDNCILFLLLTSRCIGNINRSPRTEAGKSASSHLRRAVSKQEHLITAEVVGSSSKGPCQDSSR